MNKIKSISFLLILFTAFSLAQEELKISDAVKITLENNLLKARILTLEREVL